MVADRNAQSNANHMVNWNWTWCVQAIGKIADQAIGSQFVGNQLATMVAGPIGSQFVKDVVKVCQLCALLGTVRHAARWKYVIAQYSKGCQT